MRQIGPSSRMTHTAIRMTGQSIVLNVGPDQDLPRRRRTGRGAARREPDRRRRRERRADGRIRQRQEHAVAPDRRARCRRWRRDHAGRRAVSELSRCRPRGIAARPARPGVSAIQPDPEPHRRRQSRFSSRALPAVTTRPGMHELVERLGLGKLAETLSRAIVRRPAAAGRDRPRAGDKTAAAARRRADRQSRRGDRRRGAGAGARSGDAHRLRLPDGDAQRAARRHARPPGQSACRG